MWVFAAEMDCDIRDKAIYIVLYTVRMVIVNQQSHVWFMKQECVRPLMACFLFQTKIIFHAFLVIHFLSAKNGLTYNGLLDQLSVYNYTNSMNIMLLIRLPKFNAIYDLAILLFIMLYICLMSIDIHNHILLNLTNYVLVYLLFFIFNAFLVIKWYDEWWYIFFSHYIWIQIF
jgi:hypothetical protein